MISFSCSSVQFCARKAEAAAARRWRAGGRRAATWRGTRTLAAESNHRLTNRTLYGSAFWRLGEGRVARKHWFFVSTRSAVLRQRPRGSRRCGVFWKMFRHQWDFATRSFAVEGSWCSFGRSKGNFFLFIEQPVLEASPVGMTASFGPRKIVSFWFGGVSTEIVSFSEIKPHFFGNFCKI